MISMRYWLPANSVVISYFVNCGFVGRLVLNILSMRSVMKNPPTTLLVAATMAMTPSTVANVLFLSPTRTMAPTTAMASRALVSDMSGVCSRGETWRMTSNPMKAASINTNNALMMLDSILLPQGLKPRVFPRFTAPLKPCPSRKPSSHLSNRGRQGGHLEKLANARIHHFASVGDHGLANNFILQIQLQF